MSSYLDVRRTMIITQLGSDFVESGDELVFHCHNCPTVGKRNDDRKLYVNKITGYYWCHRCELRGRLAFNKHIKDFKTLDITEDIYKYFSDIGNDSDDDEFIYKEIPKATLISAKEYSQGYDYMISRGFTEDMIRESDMRVSTSLENPKLFGRVIIPNKVISTIFTDIYVARSFIGDTPKYLYPPDSKKSDIVYNIHNIPNGVEKLFINEGALDSIMVGLNRSVSLYGKHCSTIQLNQLLDVQAKSYYVSLDPDALDQSTKLCEDLHSRVPNGVKIYQVILPEGKDAVDLGRNQYLRLAINSEEYIPNRLRSIFKYFD